MLKFIQKTKLFLLAATLVAASLATPAHALEPKDLTKNYTAIIGTDLQKTWNGFPAAGKRLPG